MRAGRRTRWGTSRWHPHKHTHVTSRKPRAWYCGPGVGSISAAPPTAQGSPVTTERLPPSRRCLCAEPALAPCVPRSALPGGCRGTQGGVGMWTRAAWLLATPPRLEAVGVQVTPSQGRSALATQRPARGGAQGQGPVLPTSVPAWSGAPGKSPGGAAVWRPGAQEPRERKALTECVISPQNSTTVLRN